MDIVKNYPDNLLAITDEQVIADWRLGFGRAVAKAVVEGYPSLRFEEPSERFGGSIPGGMNDHIEGALTIVKDADGITVERKRVPACPIVAVYNITESSGKRYDFDSYGGSGDGTPVTVISALASCACGKIIKKPASTEIPAGEFMAAVTNAG